MNKEEFKTRLDACGLGKHFDQLAPLLRNTIRLYQQATDEKNIPVGQTKIGGRPDLPTAITWATETSLAHSTEERFLGFDRPKETTATKPLSFIAQINLSETAPFDLDNVLPKTGILYFFYSAAQEVWGFDYQDKNKFEVIYWNGDFAELKRLDFPHDLPVSSRYKPCSVGMQSELSLPSYGHDVYENFADDEVSTFWQEVYEDGNLNKLLGYSDNIQGEMELECELVTNGLYCGDPSGYNDPRAKALEPNAKNWRLLLQIDSNEENEMMWGDCGRLYFWIKKGDLVNKQFDQSWFSLQCC
ncbi:MAG: DUF1963 domain-containing protein [Saprospiraceae bacterium]|nr:DUF1963 domain-containing protein [Saprospiraceae bacterium]